MLSSISPSTAVWQELLTQPWWSYDPATTGPWGLAYRWFNLFEGVVWLAFAGLVLKRWVRQRRSICEIGYALAFLTFGLTDFREAYVQSTALVLFKAANLLILLGFRHIVLTRLYPGHRLY